MEASSEEVCVNHECLVPGICASGVRWASTRNPTTALSFSRLEECDTTCGRSGACEGLESVPGSDDVRLTEFHIVE